LAHARQQRRRKIATAGCGTYHDRTASAEPKRTATQTVSDAAIAAKVKTAFAADDLVRAHKINVDTVQGVVTLHGTVKGAAEKSRAMDIARRVDGVVGVKDNLRTAG
jgi:hyperosmotically inducible periplasmic protein